VGDTEGCSVAEFLSAIGASRVTYNLEIVGFIGGIDGSCGMPIGLQNGQLLIAVDTSASTD
jgi:hypothetical protein